MRAAAWVLGVVALSACAADRGGGDAAPLEDLATAAPDLASAPDLAVDTDALGANRDRLLATYLAWLQAHAGTPQSNGLDGATLPDVCTLWARLDPSSRDTFLTLTARLQGAKLGADLRSALSHVTRLYRVSGGQGATASAPGSCGGGEYNRMMASMDATLQAAFVAANAHKGQPSGGIYDLADLPVTPTPWWRDSHDLAGPHAPFTLSDETEAGGPRGQTQYFADPTSAAAQAPLGRLDLETLVDPYALEMDQDYDCAHNSNPLCTYIFYGALCVAQPAIVGVDLYAQKYGSPDVAWQPSGCAGDGGI